MRGKKVHLRARRDQQRTCCGWYAAGLRISNTLDRVPEAERCKICERRERFAVPAYPASMMFGELDVRAELCRRCWDALAPGRSPVRCRADGSTHCSCCHVQLREWSIFRRMSSAELEWLRAELAKGATPAPS